MKKKQRSGIGHVDSVQLYLEEVEELFALTSRFEKRSITVNDDYEMDSVAEIAEHFTKPLQELRIEGRTELNGVRLDVSVGFMGVNLTTFGGGDRELAAMAEMKSVLDAHRRRSTLASASRIFAATTIIVMVALLTLFLTSTSLKWTWVDMGLFGVTLVAAAGVWMSAPRAPLKSKVIPRFRRDSTNFWSRNRDQIGVALIAAVFGALLTLLVTWLL